EFDPFVVARAWYGYSQEALPPPGDLPGRSAPIKARLCEHEPARMSTIIFRSAPALAQTMIAERMQDEGGYDDELFLPEYWFKRTEGYTGDPVKVGGPKEMWWSRRAWLSAQKMWRKFGIDNHVLVDDRERKRLELNREKFRQRMKLNPGEEPANLDV